MVPHTESELSRPIDVVIGLVQLKLAHVSEGHAADSRQIGGVETQVWQCFRSHFLRVRRVGARPIQVGDGGAISVGHSSGLRCALMPKVTRNSSISRA